MNLELRNTRLRFVEESDASFILNLRLDPRYNLFLSSVTPSLESQVEWIRGYKLKESNKSEFYFIIERTDGSQCGTIRIYDLKDDSFCWGSWILNESKTRYMAIESAFLIYEFGFEYLGCNRSHFEVMKGNSKVISFHEKMGAIKVREDEDNYYFEISKKSVLEAKLRLLKRLK